MNDAHSSAHCTSSCTIPHACGPKGDSRGAWPCMWRSAHSTPQRTGHLPFVLHVAHARGTHQPRGWGTPIAAVWQSVKHANIRKGGGGGGGLCIKNGPIRLSLW